MIRWDEPGADPVGDVRAAVELAADDEHRAELYRRETLLRQAADLQDPRKLRRLVLVFGPAVASIWRTEFDG